MKKIAIAIALVALASCADLDVRLNQRSLAGGGGAFSDTGQRDWQRQPARADYPYNPKGL
jgi:hypothetical protein